MLCPRPTPLNRRQLSRIYLTLATRALPRSGLVLRPKSDLPERILEVSAFDADRTPTRHGCDMEVFATLALTLSLFYPYEYESVSVPAGA
jgi:hypothetical protein